MRHVPHLVVAAPWNEDQATLSVVQWRHLTKVLRLRRGDPVTYTDGLGTLGSGALGNQVVERGEEHLVERPSQLTLAVAPPSNKDRQRFLVEKLAELGVARLIWLETRHGTNRAAAPGKVFSWVLTATEQSRGAWLMETSSGLTTMADLDGEVTICHPGGGADPGTPDVVVVGPEGGLVDEELPVGAHLWSLGPTILRVETAALVAAARIVG